MKFQDAYNKIVTAYYKNELNPWAPCACFVGNLLNNRRDWGAVKSSENFIWKDMFYPHGREQRNSCEIEVIKEQSNGFYSSDDISRLEYNFIMTLQKSNSENREEYLFKAMESTLELLRKIHEEKGEIVKDYTFTKRELVNI